MTSNIRLRSNVLCVRNEDDCIGVSEIIARLGYFELLSYMRVNPVLFHLAGQQPTSRQQQEMNGPRARGADPLATVWQLRNTLRAPKARRVSLPFSATATPDEIVHRGQSEPATRTEGLIPDTAPPDHERSDAEDAPLGDADQREFVEGHPGQDTLVVAPPGTGKTHALIERLAWLIAGNYVEAPLSEVLVLSFTRAAVGELTKRLSKRSEEIDDGRLAYCRVRTFDGYATELLMKDLTRSQLAQGYGARVRQLVDGLRKRKLPNAEAELAKVRHFFVDEVQDLRGDRADLVLVIAERIKAGGGTVGFLGDPAQSIYDFEDDRLEAKISSKDFLEAVKAGRYCGTAPVRIEFTTYRRFETDEMQAFVRRARNAVGDGEREPDAVELDVLLQSLGSHVSLKEIVAQAQNGKLAILARTNLEAYQLWEWCGMNGVCADLWRGQRGGYWPGWISILMLSFQGDIMSLALAGKRWNALDPMPALTFEEAIKYLGDSGLLTDDGTGIPASDLPFRMARSAPVPSQRSGTGSVVISTIHRSKGLEFDHVLVVAPRPARTNHASGGDEVRVMYVAATRARRTLRILERSKDVLRNGARNGRHLKTHTFHLFNCPSYPSIGLLLDGFETINPSSVLAMEDPASAQRALWASACGRERTLELSSDSAILSGERIGAPSVSLNRDITSVKRIRELPASYLLQGVRVVDLASIPVEDPEGTMGSANLVLVPVTTGIGSC